MPVTPKDGRMQADRIIKRFTAKDGTPVTLRAPRWEDLDDLLTLINALVDEEADIFRDHRVERSQEAEWLGRALADMENGKTIRVVAEVHHHVVASAEVTRQPGSSRHVGAIGIAISRAYRDVGIGTEMLRTLLRHSRDRGLTMLYLHVFATNHRAIHVYEKIGFTKTGVRPNMFFRNGRYIDDIIMTMELPDAKTPYIRTPDSRSTQPVQEGNR